MKTLMTFLTATAVSTCVFAADGELRKIDSDFDSLDNNNDMYISKEEADDNNVWDHFSAIDKNGDQRLSEAEFRNYLMSNPDVIEKGEELPERE